MCSGRDIDRQFNCLSYDKKLEYINNGIFKYTENDFFSTTIKDTLDEDENLQLVFQENNGVGNLGYV